MTQHTLRIGTRGSALARAQAKQIAAHLKHNGIESDITIIQTLGDLVLDRSLESMPSKGVFVKEIEEALKNGEIDLAVHSLKDLPVAESEELLVAAITAREEPADVLISRDGAPLQSLIAGARIGTSSARRRVLLGDLRPDCEILQLRGNVDTRLRKLAIGSYDAIVLAAAGLHRLKLTERISETLPLDTFVPAPGQGALALQCRRNDKRVSEILESLCNHQPTRLATSAERAVLEAIGGGCAVPLGAHAHFSGDFLTLQAVLATGEPIHLVRITKSAQCTNEAEAKALGNKVASALLSNT